MAFGETKTKTNNKRGGEKREVLLLLLLSKAKLKAHVLFDGLVHQVLQPVERVFSRGPAETRQSKRHTIAKEITNESTNER